jgi:hypothetical protein
MAEGVKEVRCRLGAAFATAGRERVVAGAESPPAPPRAVPTMRPRGIAGIVKALFVVWFKPAS